MLLILKVLYAKLEHAELNWAGAERWEWLIITQMVSELVWKDWRIMKL